MLELSIKEKERIGKLLKYYRKKNKVQWKEIGSILSKSTYWKLENGKISKKIEIYNKLFNLYDLTYLEKDNFKEWFNDYLIRMNDALEYCIEEEYDSLIDELEKELGPYKNTIIYEQYYQVITYILNYYQYSKYMTMEEIEDCFLLFDCFDFEETIIDYLLETIFISNNNKHASYEVLNLVKNLLKEENPIHWYLFAGYYKVNAQFDTALKYFKKSYEFWNNKNNYYRTVRSLIGKFMIYKNIDKIKANEIMDELLTIKENHNLNQQLLENINYTIAMYKYLEKEYCEAYSLFEENFKKKKNDRELLFMCAICSQLDKEIPIDIHDSNYIDHPYKEYLYYFKLKHLNKENKELVAYIMQVIVPLKLEKQIYKQPFWEMFELELTNISLKDKRLAIQLVEYIQKKNKVCGNN